MLFVTTMGQWEGYMKGAEGLRNGCLATIEDNTNVLAGIGGSGLFRRTSHKISDINKGFASYDS